MNDDHERYADWDAAYVLGALVPADRRAYEGHLEDCDRCRAAVAELAPMPGLLARLDAESAAAVEATDAEALLGTGDLPASAPDDSARRGTAAARGAEHRDPAGRAESTVPRRHAPRRPRRLRVLAAIAASVLLVAVAVVGVVTATLQGDDAEVVAMEPVGDTPLTASIAISSVPWGTRLSITCRYGTGEWTGEGETWEYGLYVTDAAGEQTQVSTWHAGEGQVVRLDAGTALERDDLVSIEVRALGTGEAQLEADLP
ncbi:anti-sigma factor family protein [Agromyces sp. M3QZ16-3]|uniref:anti-sigma factor family protein n=1 Tax=Agromyces sp. M3QZ16-3 TaxID=3447585 RepID=UPI003F6947A1